MIDGFMSSETQPPAAQEAASKREADIYDLIAWIEVNKAKVATVAVALVAIGFILATVRYMREKKETGASAALLALKPALNPQTNAAPVQPSALLKVAEDFSGTAAAERALILAAATHFTEGKYAEAEAAYSRYQSGHAGGLWSATAGYGLAAAQEAQGKTKEAQASYQGVAAGFPNSSLADSAKMALARMAESQKQPEQALRLYNELLAPKLGAQPGEMPNPAAAERKEALLRANPHLATNAPAISASSTGATTVIPAVIPSVTATNVTVSSPTNSGAAK